MAPTATSASALEDMISELEYDNPPKGSPPAFEEITQLRQLAAAPHVLIGDGAYIPVRHVARRDAATI